MKHINWTTNKTHLTGPTSMIKTQIYACIQIIALFILFASIKLAAANSNNQNKSNIKNYFSIDGIWRTDCYQGKIKEQIIKEPFIWSVESFFQDTVCTKPSITFISYGIFTRDIQNMNYTFYSVSISTNNKEISSQFNETKMCELKNWTINTPLNISGRKCFLFSPLKATQIPQIGDRRFGIYKIENHQLYMGRLTSEKNSLTPDSRPNSWDPTFYQKK